MTAKYNQNTDTGVTTADTSDLLADVQNEYLTTFGPNLSTDSSTPQGMLIEGETVARTDVMKFNAELSNMINPEEAFGVYLDSICSLMAIQRKAATPTQASNIVFKGVAGTIIPTGALMTSKAGDSYTTLADITLESGGVARGIIQAVKTGPLALTVNEALTITNPISGWDSVALDSNSLITLGSDRMTDAQLRTFRKLSLAKQGVGTTGSLRAALLELVGVTSIKMIENITGVVQSVDGISFTLPYALWVCVAGTPNPSEVAKALWRCYACRPYDFGTKNGNPCNTDGYSVEDIYSGQSYTVKWVTPVIHYCFVNLSIKQGTSVYAGQAIIEAILDWANGRLSSDEGLVVGRSVSAFDIGGAVASQLPGLYIEDCKIALSDNPDTPPSQYEYKAELNPWEQAIIEAGLITITGIS